MPVPVPDENSPVARLKPDVFDILLILLDGPAHGYAMVQALVRANASERTVDRGNTYRLLRRMLADELIELTPSRRTMERTGRERATFVITPAGRRAAKAEALRLEKLVRVARRQRLLLGD